MKKWLCAALGALLMLALCAGALAAGNVTIVAQDRDGFDDYISSMFVWDGRLLMSSWDKLYVYTPGEKGVTEVEGFDQLQGALNESISDPADGTGTLKLGDTERVVVSGIAKFYTPEEMVGKKVVLLANLAPRKIRGVESHGRLLCAANADDSKLSLLTVDADMEDGCEIG